MMATFQLSKSRRLLIIIAVSFSFFCAEIAGQGTLGEPSAAMTR